MGSKVSKYIQLLEGEKKVLVSAPHAYDHRRPSLSTYIKQAEPWTDVIVRSCASETDCFGMIQRETREYDPNYHKLENNPYKKYLNEVIREQKIEYLLDIHGLSDQYPLDVVVYYPRRYRKSRSVADALASQLDEGALKDLSIHIFNFDSILQESISEFVSGSLGIPAIQIEIARYIREDQLLRQQLIDSLSTFVQEFSLLA